MKAVILAAGEGRRIGAPRKGRPKPLMRLLGLPLILRSVLTLKEAGIKDIVVVVGYRGDLIKERIGDGRRYGVRITYVENPNWKEGNALSLLSARGKVGKRFLLLMADHVFSPEIIRRLSLRRPAPGEAIVAIDSSPAEYIDMEDATKVLLKEGIVRGVGKELKDYNAVDCGAFMITEEVMEYAEKVVEAGKDSLNHVMNSLSMEGRLKAFDIGEEFWIDVDTEEALKIAEKLLLNNLIKPTDGFISRVLNRPVSKRITRWLVNTSLTPNTLSIISFVICLISAALFSIGNYISFLIGGLLAQFTSVLDGCDGEVARLKFQSSRYGAWLDAVLDRYGDAAIVLGIIYGLWNYSANPNVWLVGYVALVGSLVSSYTATKYDELIRKTRDSTWRFGRDTRLFLVMVFSILNELYLFLVFIGVLSNLVSLRRLYIMRKATV